MLAFGEYFPIISSFPKLEEKLGLGSFERGDGPEAIPVNGFSLGPQICYESLFPIFSKGLSDAGANVFINVTNDSWFGPTSEPFQNMIMTLSRSLEFRRPTIRATNTGFTSAMDATGKSYKKSSLFTEQAIYYDIPLEENPKETLYQQFPYLPEVALSLMLVLFLIPRSTSKRD
ncbi:MAG: nitrilase-related carbon-nitrogen hydrolase [Bdellovibrionales bacterium]